MSSSNQNIETLSIDKMFIMFKEIDPLPRVKSGKFKRYIENQYPELFNAITTYYTAKYKDFSEICYLLSKQMLTAPTCICCGKSVLYKSYGDEYSKTCGTSECIGNLRKIQNNKLYSGIVGVLLLSDEELVIELNTLFDGVKSCGYYNKIRYNNKKLFPLIHTRTRYLSVDCPLNERIYHILNELHEVQLCPWFM